jgi:hypothetical protein
MLMSSGLDDGSSGSSSGKVSSLPDALKSGAGNGGLVA